MTTSGKQVATLPGAARAAVQAFVAQARVPADAGPTTMLVTGGAAAAAQVATSIAAGLQRELVRVPLGAVASTHPDETATRLDRVFADAAASGAVLLFDEADALFGRRGDVKDAHDRYANAAADGLVRRLASHAGAAILATRKKQDVDGAFTRRLAIATRVELPD